MKTLHSPLFGTWCIPGEGMPNRYHGALLVAGTCWHPANPALIAPASLPNGVYGPLRLREIAHTGFSASGGGIVGVSLLRPLGVLYGLAWGCL